MGNFNSHGSLVPPIFLGYGYPLKSYHSMWHVNIKFTIMCDPVAVCLELLLKKKDFLFDVAEATIKYKVNTILIELIIV